LDHIPDGREYAFSPDGKDLYADGIIYSNFIKNTTTSKTEVINIKNNPTIYLKKIIKILY
jgi:hypothetical protein